MSQMHNPYAEERCKAVFEIGHGAAWLFAIVFMSVLWVPPLWQHIAESAKGRWKETPAGAALTWRPEGTKPFLDHVTDHLKKIEKSLTDVGYAVDMRQTVQGWLTRYADEGTRKSFIGYNGMLFYTPDLKALTGYGPLKPEPFSVMKDPELAKLPDAKEMVLKFAAQLQERGIALLLVPVPLKPMIYSENVTGKFDYEWLTHPDAPEFYDQLRAAGIDVLELKKEFAGLREKREHIFVRVPDLQDKAAIAEAAAQARELKQAFLFQDTHWSPDAMLATAQSVAAYIRQKYPQALQPRFKGIRAVDGVDRSSLGDLVKLLDLKKPEALFTPEEEFLKVVGDGTEDKDSPISLLGDSFVNVYDDPTLGFEDPARPKERIHAGFAQQLSLALQQPLDVIAMNGRGSTGVRRSFAARPDDEVRTKKLVVWVIASRDLLLSRTAAREANIEWGPVTFNPNRSANSSTTAAPAANEAIVITAKLVEKSKNQDPNGSPYRDALHTALYDVESVVSGKLDAKQVLAVEWTFKDKQMQPTASFAPGQRYQLTLVPWESKKDLQTINRQEDVLVFDAPMMFAEKAEAVK